jgi:subtilisin family serine protease
VRFRPAATTGARSALQAVLGARGVREFRATPGLQLIQLPSGVTVQEALAAAWARPDVLYAEPNQRVTAFAVPRDPGFPDQWALRNDGQTGSPGHDIGAVQAWDLTTGGGAVVAVVDTGVDLTHPDLLPNLYRNEADCDANGTDDDADGYADDCHGINAIAHTGDPTDDNGHGTHVAGILGAAGDNGIGISGVAWSTRILGCKFLDRNGEGLIGDAIACLDHIAALKDRGVPIVAINASWGGSDASLALADAIDAQRQRGILVVAAAGNDGLDVDVAPTYPCALQAPNVICVGASTPSDTSPTWSNFGRRTVHLLAPGENILSTVPGVALSTSGPGYQVLDGTSMAAPHVTGTVALLRALRPDSDWREMRNRILASVDPIAGARTISGGRLNAFRALTCQDRAVEQRLLPRASRLQIAVGAAVELAALNLSCGAPAGELAVVVEPGGSQVVLRDDGLAPDRAVGDGVYAGRWTAPAGGHFELVFPGGDRVVVEVDADLKPGFPAQLWVNGAPQGGARIYALVGDVDGDARSDILVSRDASGLLYAFRADGSALPGWPVAAAASCDGPVYPALARGPAGARIVSAAFCSRMWPTRSWLAAYDHLGTRGPVLQWAGVGSEWSAARAPLVADLDGDGADEIVANGAILRVGGTSALPGVPVQTGIDSPAAADLLGDGTLDLAFVYGGLRVLDAAGALWPGYPVQQAGAAPVIGDVDGDGAPELVLLATTGPATSELRIFGVDGLLQATVPLAGATAAPPALADLDGDGRPEIVVQTSDPGALNVVRADGTPLAGWPVIWDASTEAGDSAPVVGDVDGDGQPDIVVTTHVVGSALEGHVRAHHLDGTALARFPKALPIGRGAVPAIADLEQSGRNQIVVLGTGDPGKVGLVDALWVYDLGGGPHGPVLWGQYMGNAGHTGAAPIPVRTPRSYVALRITAQGYGTVAGEAIGIDCGSSCSRLLAPGRSVELTARPATGYALAGWGGACSGAGATCLLTMDAAKEVTATFAALPHTVTVTRAGRGSGAVSSLPGGLSCGNRCSASFDAGSRVILTAAPDAGSRFLRWTGACSGTEAACAFVLNADAAVTAEFGLPLRALSVSRSGTGSGAVTSAPAGIDCGRTCTASFEEGTEVTLTATAASGSVFAGWSGACSGTAATCTVSIAGATSVVAAFGPATTPPVRYALAVSVAGSGSVTSQPAGIDCGATCTASYDAGAQVTLSATPAAGWTFGGWGGACAAAVSATCTVTLNAVKTVTATFSAPTPVRHALTVGRTGAGAGTVTSQPAGIDCGAACLATYDAGTQVTLTATPAAGSVFTGWGGACGGTSPTCTFPMDAATSVTAGFSLAAPARCALSVSLRGSGTGAVHAEPAGIDCPTACAATYDAGATVTLTATPGSGSAFAGWSGACSGAGPTCALMLGGDVQVAAEFRADAAPARRSGGGGCSTGAAGGLDAGAIALVCLTLFTRLRGDRSAARRPRIACERARTSGARRWSLDVRRRWRWCAVSVALVVAVAGCGRGGGVGQPPSGQPATASDAASGGTSAATAPGAPAPPPDGLWQAPSDRIPASGGYVYLESDPGDPVGAGQQLLIPNKPNAASVSLSGRELYLGASNGGPIVKGRLEAMAGAAQLTPGYYDAVTTWPGQDPAHGAMSWSVDARSCASLTGWFSVDDVVFIGGQVEAVVFRFEQRCDGAAGALRGQVFWERPVPPPQPPPPTEPVPAGLWRPAPGATPATGSFVYLEAEQGDWIGAGGTLDRRAQTYLYTQADAVLGVSAAAAFAGAPAYVSVLVNGFEKWSGAFDAMASIPQVVPGYYAWTRGWSEEASLAWTGEGRGCTRPTGWFAVDAIAWSGSQLRSLDLRFEQHCDGALPALHGQIHWDVADPTMPPRPVNPPPAGLWDVPAGAVPDAGNYLYVQSDPGDPGLRGLTDLCTQATCLMSVSATGGTLRISAWGDHMWTAEFTGELTPGYHPQLRRPISANPTRGGFELGPCNTSESWVAIDRLELGSNLSVSALDLRFEQHCEFAVPAIRGKLHWVAGDPTAPPGPQVPPPAGLWDAPAGATPATGSYVYLSSSLGDPVGLGQTYLYRGSQATITALTVTIPDRPWRGELRMPQGLPLQVGWFHPLRRQLSGSPVRAYVGWSGGARGCNQVTGWLAVDSLELDAAGAPVRMDLRFEQHCEGIVPALRGKIHLEPGG